MQTFDISPLFRSSTGSLDRVWDTFNTSIGFESAGWPKYDVLKTADHEYRISLAVPGFSESEISVEVRDNRLWISGRKEADPNHNQYLFKGLRHQEFQRSFQLPEHVKVTGARLNAGLLHVELVREIPEELKPRRIEIQVADEKPPFEGQSEAA